MTLTWYDFVVIAVLVYTAFRGAQKGLVSQLAWIVALVLCFAFAEGLSLKLAPKIQEIAPTVQSPLDRWIAMLILYMGFSFGSFGIARVLRGWIEKAKFVEYDRHLGGLFGFVKGVVMCLVGTFFLITLSEKARETVLSSQSGYAAAVVMNTLEPVMPKELAEVLAPYMQRLDPSHSPEGELNEGGPLDPFGANDILFGNSGGNEGSNSGLGEPGDLGSPGGGLWDRITGGGSTTPDPGLPSTGGGGGVPAENVSLNDFIRSLPASMSREVKDSAVESFRQATPEQREQLTKQIQSVLPENVGGVLNQFNRFRERWNNDVQGGGGQPVVNRDSILNSISQLFSDRADKQTSFRQQVNQRLTGVPAQVATSVLADWQADLNGAENDPDPVTNFQTKLDERIYRQLVRARVRMDQLSQGLQDRMRNQARQ